MTTETELIETLRRVNADCDTLARRTEAAEQRALAAEAERDEALLNSKAIDEAEFMRRIDERMAGREVPDIRDRATAAEADAEALAGALQDIADRLGVHEPAWEHECGGDEEADDCRACEYSVMLGRARAALANHKTPSAALEAERERIAGPLKARCAMLTEALCELERTASAEANEKGLSGDHGARLYDARDALSADDAGVAAWLEAERERVRAEATLAGAQAVLPTLSAEASDALKAHDARVRDEERARVIDTLHGDDSRIQPALGNIIKGHLRQVRAAALTEAIDTAALHGPSGDTILEALRSLASPPAKEKTTCTCGDVGRHRACPQHGDTSK